MRERERGECETFLCVLSLCLVVCGLSGFLGVCTFLSFVEPVYLSLSSGLFPSVCLVMCRYVCLCVFMYVPLFLSLFPAIGSLILSFVINVLTATLSVLTQWHISCILSLFPSNPLSSVLAITLCP